LVDLSMRWYSRFPVERRALLGLGSFQFLTFLRRGVFYTFMYIYLFGLMGNVTTTAALGTLTMLMSTAGQNAVWGRISDRYRLRAKLVVFGELLAGIAYIIVFLIHKHFVDWANNIAAGLTLIVGLAILEFFWSMSDVGWSALLTDITTPEIRGAFVGTFNFIASLGRMTGILAAGFLYGGGSGFRQGTIFYAVTAMLFTGAAIMWFSSKSLEKTSRPTTVSQETTTEISPQKKVESTFHGNEKIFSWFLVSLTVVILGATSVNQIFPLFLQLREGLNASDVEISLVLTAFTVGGMTASVLGGRLADKIGRVKVISAGLLLAVATPLIYGVVPSVGFMAIVYGLNGVSFMLVQTAGFALAGDTIPEHRRGRLLSRYNAVIALSWGPAGLLIGGPLSDFQTGVLNFPRRTAYTNAFIADSLLVLVGVSIFSLKVARSGVKT